MQNSHTTRQEEHDEHIAALKKAADESRARCAAQDRSKAIMPKVVKVEDDNDSANS